MRPHHVLIGALLFGCGNPAVDPKIDALGGEVNGVAPGPYHRPGQPCALCHGPYKGVKPYFSVAGTVFAHDTQKPENRIPVGAAVVHVVDSFGDTRDLTSNCIGNFYVSSDDWQPAFPLDVTIDCPKPTGKGTTSKSMSGRIGREPSCGGCHYGGHSASSPGWVSCLDLSEDNTYPPATHATCPEGIP